MRRSGRGYKIVSVNFFLHGSIRYLKVSVSKSVSQHPLIIYHLTKHSWNVILTENRQEAGNRQELRLKPQFLWLTRCVMQPLRSTSMAVSDSPLHKFYDNLLIGDPYEPKCYGAFREGAARLLRRITLSWMGGDALHCRDDG